jgi:hypothetical protein
MHVSICFQLVYLFIQRGLLEFGLLIYLQL